MFLLKVYSSSWAHVELVQRATYILTREKIFRTKDIGKKEIYCDHSFSTSHTVFQDN
jgi:hypothetical protein